MQRWSGNPNPFPSRFVAFSESHKEILIYSESFTCQKSFQGRQTEILLSRKFLADSYQFYEKYEICDLSLGEMASALSDVISCDELIHRN